MLLVTFVAHPRASSWARTGCSSLRLDQSEEAQLRKRLKPDPVGVDAPKKFRLLKPLEQLSSVRSLNTVLGQMGRITAPLQRDITQAGLTVDGRTLLLVGRLPVGLRLTSSSGS